MSAIKTVHQFVVTIQLLALIVFLGYVIGNGVDLTIPIYIRFSDDFTVNYDFRLNEVTILGYVTIVGLIYIASSIQAVGSGLGDGGVYTLRKYVAFISQYLILITPIVYIVGISEYLSPYIVSISLIILIIEFIYLNDSEKELS